LQKQGRFAFGYHNRVIVGLGTELALLLLVFFVFGVWSVCFVLIQALVGILLLEAVNYIEHYGLLRERNANDTYNAVTPIHSWNSSHWLTNRFLFNLQRHSDHHYLPGRRYHLLRHYDESPQLPTGYAGMILIAVIPPLWRRLNDPKIEILHNQALKT
jgi:alkane 1-monooxygenase